MAPSILILLAEDEPLIGLALQDSLEAAGFSVRHVLSAADAMNALDSDHAALSGLITDIQFGGELDGWAIARHARELKPNVPVVYMSGDSAHDHTVQGVPESVMLQKPFAPAQLITALSNLLNAAPPHPPEIVAMIQIDPKPSPT